jgi:hypothetical protein
VGIEALVLRHHRMQLAANPVKSSFETQHNRSENPQIVAYRILIGNHSLKLFPEKLQSNPLTTHAVEHGRF